MARYIATIFDSAFIYQFVRSNYAPDRLRALVPVVSAQQMFFDVALDGDHILGFCNIAVTPRGAELFRIYVRPATLGRELEAGSSSAVNTSCGHDASRPTIASSRRHVATFAIFLLVVAASVWLGFGLRRYALSQVTALYTPAAAVLSPALLTEEELRTAYRMAAVNARVETALRRAAPGTLIIYVVPLEWRLPDLPLERDPSPGPHHQPTGSIGVTTKSSSRTPARTCPRVGPGDRPERVWARPDRGCPCRHLGPDGDRDRDSARARPLGGHPDPDF